MLGRDHVELVGDHNCRRVRTASGFRAVGCPALWIDSLNKARIADGDVHEARCRIEERDVRHARDRPDVRDRAILTVEFDQGTVVAGGIKGSFAGGGEILR